MKKTLMVALLCFFGIVSKSQSITSYIVMTDQSQITSYNNGIPVFLNQDINDVFDLYNVGQFGKVYPLSGYEYLQILYQFTTDSPGMAAALYSVDSLLFPFYQELDTPFLLSNPPNDWVSADNDTSHLISINAVKAWNYSTGDSNTIIGVTDSYFDLNHEDLIGQYAQVGTNVMDKDIPHGTYVAGLIAAKTNNNKGMSSIGYNCRLNVSSLRYNDSVMLAMAVDTTVLRTRVLNASWVRGTLETLDFEIPNNLSSMKYAEGAYNEIYEHGVSVVAGAGNGRNILRPLDVPTTFMFPASYDHNLSISTVGHHGSSGTWNVNDVHELHVGDSVWECHNHNKRVDLCAPGYFISSTYFSPSSSDKYKNKYASGTSFSAPLVAGTIGLMYSKMKWLTPYQIEYVLKTSARDLYGIPENQKYARGTSRHTGLIGSGTLDAGAALEMLNTDGFFTDHPDARTFRIKGATITHKCRPGTVLGMPNPQIKVHLENGTPPYTYKWERLVEPNSSPAANGVTISPRINTIGAFQITGTLDSAWGPGKFYYRLTVYDNSEIQKVANKVFRMELINDPNKWELAMQDSYADLYDEPNEMLKRSPLDWNIWKSPDVWNRYLDDGDTTHQDPDIAASASMTNFMHVRVRNVGCAASPNNPEDASLEMYWTVAATGERWPMDWTGNSSQINGQPSGGLINPGGTPIPSIPAGGTTILSHSWNPPNPTLYDTTNTLTRIDICALARITGSPFSPFGMTFPEVDTSKVNILNNNNLVTRNFVSLNMTLGTSNPPTRTGVVIRNPSGGNTSGNPPKGAGMFSIELITENQAHPFVNGNLSKYLDVTMHLGDLYDVWVNGGRLGQVTGFDDDLKTINWNVEEPLRLNNIVMDETEQYYVILEFNIKSGLTAIPYDVIEQLIHLRLVTPQQVNIDNGDGTSFLVTRDQIHSVVNYAINIPATEGEGKPERPSGVFNVEKDNEAWFDVFPNPVNNGLTLSISKPENTPYKLIITDVLGKVMMEKDEVTFSNGKYKVNTANLAPGIYYVKLAARSGKSAVKQFIKID